MQLARLTLSFLAYHFTLRISGVPIPLGILLSFSSFFVLISGTRQQATLSIISPFRNMFSTMLIVLYPEIYHIYEGVLIMFSVSFLNLNFTAIFGKTGNDGGLCVTRVTWQFIIPLLI